MLNDSTELITDLLNLCQKKLILFLVLLFVVATKVVMLEHSESSWQTNLRKLELSFVDSELGLY